MTIHLSLSHLTMLSALRDGASLSVAADRLSITQSALTHRIREAERRLGVPLFSRQGRRLKPTAAARILTETAEHVLDALTAAERTAIASAEGIRHTVRLTVCDYNAYHWLPGFLTAFREDRPDIDLEIAPDTTDRALRRLAEGRLDIAVLPGAPGLGAGDAIPLFDDSLVAAVWPGHRFEDRPYVTAGDFEDQVYLTYSLNSRPGFEAERLWTAERALPLRKRNVGSVDAVCELIKAQAGISVLSRWGIEREIASGSLIAVQATEAGLPIRWHALIAAAQPPDAPARTVAAALADHLAERVS